MYPLQFTFALQVFKVLSFIASLVLIWGSS